MTLITHWLGIFAWKTIVCTTKVRDETFRNGKGCEDKAQCFILIHRGPLSPKYGRTFFLKDFAYGNKRFQAYLWGMLNMGTNDQIMQGRWKVSHMYFPVFWTLQFWVLLWPWWKTPQQKKWSFSLRISSVNVVKIAVYCGFGHIYWRNP